MKKMLMASAAAVLIGMPAYALAQEASQESQEAQVSDPQVAEQCMNDLEAFDREVTGMQQDQGGTTATPREFRQLREAALVFARNGNEDGCQMVLSEMQEMYETEHQRTDEASADADLEARQQEQNERLENAVAIDESQGLVRSDDLIGADVRNTSNEDLGNVETIVLDPQEGKVAYVLLSHGGFLGMGEDLIPVRWSDLRVTADGETYVLNVPLEQIENAPTINRNDFNPEAGEDWRSQIDSWWDEVTAG